MFRVLLALLCLLPGLPGVLAQSQPAASSQKPAPALYSDFALALKHPSRVERLALKNLTALPATISRFTQLRELDLTGSRLSTLPAQLGRLQKLEVLNLTCEGLSVKEFLQLQPLYGYFLA